MDSAWAILYNEIDKQSKIPAWRRGKAARLHTTGAEEQFVQEGSAYRVSELKSFPIFTRYFKRYIDHVEDMVWTTAVRTTSMLDDVKRSIAFSSLFA